MLNCFEYIEKVNKIMEMLILEGNVDDIDREKGPLHAALVAPT